MVGGLQFLVAGGDGAVLLEAVDGALHPVALAVGRPVEADAAAGLVFAAWDDRSDAAKAQVGAYGTPRVAPVAAHPIGAHPGAAASRPRHRASLQQRRQLGRFLALAGGQQAAERLAAALGAQVDFRAEPA